MAWGLAAWLLPSGVPLGIVGRGVVLGSLAGMLALGVVFVYRANAIISFAQGELGAFAATLAYELIVETGFPYALAVPLCVAAAVALSAALEVLVLRRFAQASRLIATVVTIGIAQLMLFLQLLIPLVFERYRTEVGAGRLAFPSPFKRPAFTLSGVIFSQDEVVVLVVVPVVLVGLIVFFRRSWIGTAIRGAAQNADRAGLLGIPVARLGTVSWALAGGLSGLSAILRAPITGYFPGDLGGASLLARALAAAAIGRFESLGVTFAAAIGIAVVEQLYTYSFSQSAPLDGLVLAVLVVALVARRGRTGRAAWGDVSSWQAVKEVRRTPARLAAVAEVRVARIVATVVGLAAVLLLPLVLGTSSIRLLSVVWVFAIVALALVVLTGWAGQVSLGQWAIVGIGAVTAGRLATLARPPSFVAVVLVAGAVGAAASVLLGLPALRLQGLFYGVTTLAFAVAAGGWLFKLDALRTLEEVPRPTLGGSFALDTERRFHYVVLVTALVCLLAVANLRRSRVGRLLVATRDNPRAVATFGARVAVARLTAFAVAGFLCGVAGALYVTLVQTVEPADFAAERSILLFGMAVIGGLGSIAGAVLGAVYVLGAQYFLPSWGSFLATGLGVVLFLMVFPGGLGQLAHALRERYLARVAARHGIELPNMVADRRLTGDVGLPEPGIDELVRAGAGRRPGRASSAPGRTAGAVGVSGIRRIVLLGLALGAGAAFLTPVRAAAAGLPSAWYFRPQQGGSVPLAPPESGGVPAGRLNVAFSGSLATARSVVEVEVGAASQGTLVIRLDATRSTGAAVASVVGCPAAPGWVPEDAGPWVNQPGFSCSPAVPVTVDTAGSSLSITLDKIIPTAIEGRISVLLTPAADQQTPGPAPTPGNPAPPFSLVTLDRSEAFEVKLPSTGSPAGGGPSASPGIAPLQPEAPSSSADDLSPPPGALFVPGTAVDVVAGPPLDPPAGGGLSALSPPSGRPAARRLRPAASVQPILPRWVLPLAVFLGTIAIGLPTTAVRRRSDALRDRIDGAGPDVPALEVEDLVVTFGGITAVRGVSFAVPRGQILGLIGPNGAGKTTILDAITGLVPCEGRVRIAGVDLTALDTSARAGVGLGRSFQDGRLFPSLSVAETIAVAFEQTSARIGPVAGMVRWGASARSEREVGERVDALIELMGLDAFRDKLLSELSTGSRRIVDLACMLAHGAKVLLLDEPSSGIAQRETEALGPLLLRLRAQLGCTVVLIEHDMPLITGVADRLIALEVGAVIADGTPTEVVNDPVVVEAYLGTDRATVERSGART